MFSYQLYHAYERLYTILNKFDIVIVDMHIILVQKTNFFAFVN